jgi:hypothetical protein
MISNSELNELLNVPKEWRAGDEKISWRRNYDRFNLAWLETLGSESSKTSPPTSPWSRTPFAATATSQKFERNRHIFDGSGLGRRRLHVRLFGLALRRLRPSTKSLTPSSVINKLALIWFNFANCSF